MNVEITRLADLIDYLRQRIDTDRRVLWYRGHRLARWTLSPAIWRDYDKEAERNFTNRFRSRAAMRLPVAPHYDESAHWLSIMQHYGLPTRLLDWTRSPLMAAYFALQHAIYEDTPSPEPACVWILQPHLLNVVEGFEEITPPIDAGLCAAMLTPAFTHRDPENNKVLAAMAAERDLRMFVQQGAFTIHSDNRPLEERQGSDRYLTKLVIPAENVLDVAFEVDVCGFRKGDIFPDLEHLSDELKDRRLPRRSP